jgi:hypothetical protein
MVCFQNKNPILGKFGGVLQWKILVYFTYERFVYFTAIGKNLMAIWYILLSFGIFSPFWYFVP